MPLWDVQGADQASGNERTVRVEASSPESAERKARSAGILVASVSHARVAEHMSAMPHHPPAQHAARQAPMHDDMPIVHLPHAPSYTAIVVASVMLRVFAAIAVLGAIAVLAMTIYAKVKGQPLPEVENYVPGITHKVANEVTGFIYAGELFATGIVLYAIAYLGLAVRDIARNSFR